LTGGGGVDVIINSESPVIEGSFHISFVCNEGAAGFISTRRAPEEQAPSPPIFAVQTNLKNRALCVDT
jgi:hypothetical protein